MSMDGWYASEQVTRQRQRERAEEAAKEELALRGRLDQLWGWAKAGKRRDNEGGEYYLMSVENVDHFTDHVLKIFGRLPHPAGPYTPEETK